MNVTAAKRLLVTACAVIAGSAVTRNRISFVAEMLDADDPVQAEILGKLIAASDEIRAIEKSYEKVSLNLEQAHDLLTENEKRLSEI